jgi:hypothetical protein
MKLRKLFREPAEVDLQISELFKDWQELSEAVLILWLGKF